MFHFRHSLFPLGRVLLRRLPALPQGRLHLIPVTVQIRCSGFPRLIPQHFFRKMPVKKLDDRSRRIIEARWLYNDQDGSKGATLADLAKEMGVSQERVRQLEKKAFATLKTYLKEDKDV